MKKRFIALLIAQALIVSSVTASGYASDLSDYGTQLDETAIGSEMYPDDLSGEDDLADGDDVLSETDFADKLYEDDESGLPESDLDIDFSETDDGEPESPDDGEEELQNAEDSESAGSTDAAIDAPATSQEMQVVTDELKKQAEAEKESEAEKEPEADLLIEEQLKEQEEILVGKPAAPEEIVCGDTGSFAQALSDMNIEYPCDYEAEIVIDLNEDLITGGDGEELVGADSYVLAAAEEDDANAATALLKENGYADVTCENNVIRANDRYATCRLFVMSSEPVDTRGALSVITFGETNLIQYATPAEAAIAAEMLKDDPGVWEVIPDLVMTIDGDMDADIEMDSEETDADIETDSEDTDADIEIDSEDTDAGETAATGQSPDSVDIETLEAEIREGDSGADAAAYGENDGTEISGADISTDTEDETEIPDLEPESDDEENVGRYFKGYSGYFSRAVSYMGIDRLLNNTGSINTVVYVAVIDTGYDTSCSYVNYDRVLLNKAISVVGGSVNDREGHGTFVLNQIYEATDNAVRFIPVRMYDNYGNSSASNALSAIYKSVDAGADVINYSNGASIGYYETFSAGEAALQYALNKKCYLVAAAGNEHTDTHYVWPAKSNRCLTISSISYSTGQYTDYTNYGSSVDFAAPGGDYNNPIYGIGRNNKSERETGTSMAAPYYTAVIADLKANGRAFGTLSNLIKSLKSYCNPYLTSSSSYYVGNGCVYLGNAINRTITTDMFNAIGNRAYTGSQIRPNPSVKYNGKKMMLHRDYELSYGYNVNVGTGRIYVSGRGVYTGSAYRDFNIVPRSIEKASVKIKTGKYAYAYSGTAKTPTMVVKLNGKTLQRGYDYTLTYKNNVYPGQATVVVQGIGNYKGTASCQFGISKRVTTILNNYTYILVPKAATGRVVGLKSGGMTNNTALCITSKTCSEGQQFKLTKNSDGTYSIISMKCELAVDSYNGSKNSGVNAVIRVFSKSRKSEKWLIRKCSDGTFVFVNKNSGKALNAENGAANKAAVKMRNRTNSTAQRFYLEQVSTKVVTRPYDGLCTLRASRNKSFVIDVPAGSTQSGAKLQVYRSNGTKAQKFRFYYSGNNTYRIVNVNSGKVLMPTKSKATKGAAIVQGVWKGKTCQRWRIVKKSNGTIALKNYEGYYLEMVGNTPKNGAKLRLNSYSAARRFMWVRKKE